MDNFRRILTKSEVEETATPFTNSSELQDKKITKLYIPYLHCGARASDYVYNKEFFYYFKFDKFYFVNSSGSLVTPYMNLNKTLKYRSYATSLGSSSVGSKFTVKFGTGNSNTSSVSYWRNKIHFAPNDTESGGVCLLLPFYGHVNNPSSLSQVYSTTYSQTVASMREEFGDLLYCCVDFTKVKFDDTYTGAYATSTSAGNYDIYNYSPAAEEYPWYYEEYEE